MVWAQAVEDQISYFGQTPSQLFRRAHPRKGPSPSPSLRPLLNCPEAMRLTPVNTPQAKRWAGTLSLCVCVV